MGSKQNNLTIVFVKKVLVTIIFDLVKLNRLLFLANSIMSLYDDLVSPEEIRDSRKQSARINPTSINFLQNYLATKKHVKVRLYLDSLFNRLPLIDFLFYLRFFVQQPQQLKPRVLSTATSSVRRVQVQTNPLQSSGSLVSDSSKTVGSLLGGDWNPSLEYDPFWPNDYEKITKEKKLLAESQTKQNQAKVSGRSSPVVSTTLIGRSLVDAYSDDDDDHESSNTDRPINKGTAIAPPASLTECDNEPQLTGTWAAIAPPSSVLQSTEPVSGSTLNMNVSSVAAKIMARMGYQEGKGLGKQEQGISTALQVEKTSKNGGVIVNSANNDDFSAMPPPPVVEQATVGSETEKSVTEMLKNPTRVIVLRNMVGRGQVDAELEPEVREECSKFGEVLNCAVFEVSESIVNGKRMPQLFRPANVNLPDEESVRIYIEFRRVESASKALVDLNGRYFAGRVVQGSFFDPERFKKLDLND